MIVDNQLIPVMGPGGVSSQMISRIERREFLEQRGTFYAYPVHLGSIIVFSL